MVFAYDERLQYIKDLNVPYDDTLEPKGRQNRSTRPSGDSERNRSVPPYDRYATAKKFSIARARSLGRTND